MHCKSLNCRNSCAGMTIAQVRKQHLGSERGKSMAKPTGKNAVLAILTTASLLLPAHYIEAAPPKRNEENTAISSKERVNAGAQWKAHPKKGWIRAAEIEQQRGEKKENSKPAKKKLRGNAPKKQN